MIEQDCVDNLGKVSVRRSNHNLRIVTSCVCLSLFIASLALWLDSFRTFGTLSGKLPSEKGFYVFSGRGQLKFRWFSTNVEKEPDVAWGWKFQKNELAQMLLQLQQHNAFGWLGFGFEKLKNGWRLLAPHWFVAFSMATLTALFKPPPRTRLSLRGMLVATGIIAAALAGVKILTKI